MEDFNDISSFDVAVAPSVLQEILRGSIPGVGGTVANASGGIQVVAEDWVSEDESVEDIVGGNNTTSTIFKAAMSINKYDRSELVIARDRVNTLNNFILKMGFKLSDVDEGLKADGWKQPLLERDEMGLPILRNIKNHEGDKSGSCLEKNGPSAAIEFVDRSSSVNRRKDEGLRPSTSGAKDDIGNVIKEDKEDVGAKVSRDKSWSQVVKKAPSPCNNIIFDYIPMPADMKIISPPDEVLIKGNEKFKTSIVGTFTRGAPPFHKVAAFAHKVWDNHGLVHISQKDSKNYVFKFVTLAAMNAALSKGTWYLENKPMLVHAWGSTVGNTPSMPLWVKFENMPDSYWTREGLSCLGSAIGKPLSADDLTSKLEILPFAKLCVDYKIGDALPSKLDVEVLDPVTTIKHIEEVKVSYPSKPLICTACKNLGHTVGACPQAPRNWIRRVRPVNVATTMPTPPNDSTTKPRPVPINNGNLEVAQKSSESPPVVMGADITEKSNPVNGKKNENSDTVSEVDKEAIENTNEGPWTTVQSRKSKLTSPNVTKGGGTSDLPIYSSLAKSFNKIGVKKAKRSLGKIPTSL